MRHWLAVASSIAILLASPPVLARTMSHQSGVVGHHHNAVVGNRFVVVSNTRFGNHVLVFDQFSHRFFFASGHGFHHAGRGFDQFNGADGFGGLGWWGWDGWADGWPGGGAVVASAEPPAGERGALPPRPPRSPAELPPCHEVTPIGVVIERGSGCAH